MSQCVYGKNVEWKSKKLSNLINLQNLKSLGKYQIPESLFFLPGQGL